MAVDKEVEEYLEASGNPLLDDYMDPINNQYGVFNPTQEPGFINRYFIFTRGWKCPVCVSVPKECVSNTRRKVCTIGIYST